MPDIRLSDEGIVLELVDAVRLLKMLAEILQLRIDAMPMDEMHKDDPQRAIREVIVSFLRAIRDPLNNWAKQEVKTEEPPISDACD